ncbi:unnamed protein product [Ixodes pacificus]
MAQEINEELGRCLRERGLIGEALDGVEKKTKLKREQVVYGVVAVICLLFLINALGAKAAVLISTVWPMLGSITIFKLNSFKSNKSYIYIYIYINILFWGGFVFLRCWSSSLLLLAWCAAPMQANGANIIFQKCLAGKIFKEGSLLPPMGGGGLPPPLSGGKKDGSPDNSRKMKK